jgi:cell wall-associated NlpC family hydrolase
MPPRIVSLLLAFPIAVVVCGFAAAPSGREYTTPSVVFTEMKATRYVLKRYKPTIGDRAAQIALQAVGIPYRWGGSSPGGGFDCSGLVYWAYGQLGIALPHSSYAQYDLGRPVPLSQLAPGDLLFFAGLGHVGLYIGGGRMVHAPHSGRDVEVVTLNGSNYGLRLIDARRVIPA